MQKTEAALTEFRTHRHCGVRPSHKTSVRADGGDSSFWEHFLAWMKETVEAESQALPTAHLLPAQEASCGHARFSNSYLAAKAEHRNKL